MAIRLARGIVMGGLVLSYNRIAIIVFAMLVVFFVWLLLNHTRLGLFVRALDAEAFGPLRAWLNGHVPGWRDELPPATLDALRQTPYRMVQGSAHDPL